MNFFDLQSVFRPILPNCGLSLLMLTQCCGFFAFFIRAAWVLCISIFSLLITANTNMKSWVTDKRLCSQWRFIIADTQASAFSHTSRRCQPPAGPLPAVVGTEGDQCPTLFRRGRQLFILEDALH